MEATAVEVDGGQIDVAVAGDGPLLVFVPSLGRARGDFDDLAARCVAAGYRVALPEPRGIGATTAPSAGLTMSRLGADVVAVIDHLDAERAAVVGHAFGNRVARVAATDYPDRVPGVALLACGGSVPMSPEMRAVFLGVFDDSLSPERHLDHVRTAFFAYGNDATVWRGGWHSDVAMHQIVADRDQPAERWWAAGRAQVLVVQPAADAIAVPANATAAVAAIGDRAELVMVPNAGHALLPEQPDAVAAALIGWLGRRPAWT